MYAVENARPERVRAVPRPVGQIPVDGHGQLLYVLVFDAGERGARDNRNGWTAGEVRFENETNAGRPSAIHHDSPQRTDRKDQCSVLHSLAPDSDARYQPVVFGNRGYQN